MGWSGADSPARVMSFSPVALLIDRELSWQMALSMLGPGWIAGPGIDLLPDLDLCVSAGVQAVITDDPRSALHHLARLDPA